MFPARSTRYAAVTSTPTATGRRGGPGKRGGSGGPGLTDSNSLTIQTVETFGEALPGDKHPRPPPTAADRLGFVGNDCSCGPRMKPPATHPRDCLRYGRPNWVRGLSHGGRVAGWGLLLGAAATVAAAATQPGIADLVCRAGATAGGACLLFGAWRLSKSDPAGSTPASDASVRWTLRILLAAGVAGAAFHLAKATALVAPDAFPALVVIAGAADVAGRSMLLVFLRRVAARVPDGALAQRLLRILPPYAIAAVAASTTGALASGPIASRLGLAAAIASALATLAVVYHLRRLRRCVEIQADYAQGIWSSTHGAPGTQAARPAAPPLAA